MEVIAITEVLRTIGQLVALAQTYSHKGEPIPKAEFDAAVQARNAALGQLDSDIATAQSEGR